MPQEGERLSSLRLILKTKKDRVRMSNCRPNQFDFHHPALLNITQAISADQANGWEKRRVVTSPAFISGCDLESSAYERPVQQDQRVVRIEVLEVRRLSAGEVLAEVNANLACGAFA